MNNHTRLSDIHGRPVRGLSQREIEYLSDLLEPERNRHQLRVQLEQRERINRANRFVGWAFCFIAAVFIGFAAAVQL